MDFWELIRYILSEEMFDFFSPVWSHVNENEKYDGHPSDGNSSAVQ